MLKDLKILNGNLELKFNEYTYEYTVTVESNINNLEIEYLLENDTYINIRNNNLNDYENIVYLDVYNVDKSITYTLYVYKGEINEVVGIDEFKKSLEIVKNDGVEFYQIQLLTTSIFLVIVIIFSIIFKRKIKY